MTPNDAPGREVSSIWLGTGNAVVELRVDDTELSTTLRRATRGLQRGPGSAEAVIQVRKDPQGWLVESPHCGTGHFGHIETARDWVEWAACESLLATVRSHVVVHAAGAVCGANAVLALGPSGAGKSTLAAAWCQAGRPLYGDDGVLLSPGGEVEAFRRLGKVARSVARTMGIAPVLMPFWDEGHDEVWLDPVAPEGPGWASARPVGLLAWVRWQEGAPVRIERITPGAMIARVLGQLLGGNPETAFEALSAASRSAETVTVTFGVAVDAIRALDALQR